MRTMLARCFGDRVSFSLSFFLLLSLSFVHQFRTFRRYSFPFFLPAARVAYFFSLRSKHTRSLSNNASRNPTTRSLYSSLSHLLSFRCSVSSPFIGALLFTSWQKQQLVAQREPSKGDKRPSRRPRGTFRNHLPVSKRRLSLIETDRVSRHFSNRRENPRVSDHK